MALWFRHSSHWDSSQRVRNILYSLPLPFISSLLSVNNSSSRPNLNLVTFLYSSSKRQVCSRIKTLPHAYFSNHSTLLEKVCTKDLLNDFCVRKRNSSDGCHEYSSWRPTRKIEIILKHLKQRGFKVRNWLHWRKGWETQGAEGNATQRSVTAGSCCCPQAGEGQKEKPGFPEPRNQTASDSDRQGLVLKPWRTHSKPWQRGEKTLSFFLLFSSEFPGPPISEPRGKPASAVTWVMVCWERLLTYFPISLHSRAYPLTAARLRPILPTGCASMKRKTLLTAPYKKNNWLAVSGPSHA